MCFSDDALPPFPPTGGEPGESRELVLTATDGTSFSAFIAHPSQPSSTGVVIFPDVRGLHNFYRDLVRQFAAAGHHAIAFDYFGRTQGTGVRGDDFDWKAEMANVKPDNVDADAQVAVSALREAADGPLNAVVSVGFCFGGGNSWRQSARPLSGITGCVGFYGIPERVRPAIPDMKAPLLLLVAGADMTPLSEFMAFDEELTEAGVPHKMTIFDGAPHSFFDRHFTEWAEACTAAWGEILDFIADPVPA